MRINALKYWLIPFSLHFWEMCSTYRRALSKLSCDASTKDNMGVNGNVLKKQDWMQCHYLRNWCSIKIASAGFVVGQTCAKTSLYQLLAIFLSFSFFVCDSGVRVSALEWKLYLTCSKSSIINCWIYWINKGSYSAFNLQFLPSFIKKPQWSEGEIGEGPLVYYVFFNSDHFHLFVFQMGILKIRCPYVLSENSFTVQEIGERYMNKLCSWHFLCVCSCHLSRCNLHPHSWKDLKTQACL